MAQDSSIFSDRKLSELGLSEWLIENCNTMGMATATKVQSLTIPHVLNGKDVVVRAKTGSGKTASFALPILEHLSRDPYGIFALILTPTRELACQIGDQFIALSANTGFVTAIAYGGSGYITNSGAIEDRPHILIATPGRLADLIHSGMEFDVTELKYLVLDEADQLLSQECFHEHLQRIFEPLPGHKDRQTLLFSATLDTSMKQIYEILKYDPVNEESANRVVFVEETPHKLGTTQNIKQTYCFIPEMAKETYLVTLCTELEDIKQKQKSVIIFLSTKEYCMIMARLLKNFGLKVSELHGNMKQRKRLEELMRFRSAKSNILIATALASRGLDIPQVEYVINFDIPRTAHEYIHRIGRCGRVDRCGTAITFVSQYDINLLQNIERHIQCKLSEFKVHRYQKLVMKMMEKVLIVRAGIINSVETKYLMDPHAFKSHDTLRWNGKFSDPRILGQVGFDRKTQSDTHSNSANHENKKSKTSVRPEHKALYQEFKRAFENEFDDAEMEEVEHKEEKQRQKLFYDELQERETEKKKKTEKTKQKSAASTASDEELDEFVVDEADGVDANLNVIDEEVRLKNMEQVNKQKEVKANKVGQDYHKLQGWQSFRYGKDAQKIKRIERIERAKQFQLKRKKLELKRSKRQHRQSELDLFSIYDGRKKDNKDSGSGHRTDAHKTSNQKWRSKKPIKSLMKQMKKKQTQDVKVKLSKSLRKKLTEKEQQNMKDKKRDWFKGGDIEW
eukprot:CAMPEP_0197034638 /NCGR_PEP_ID=MMETSP1384-20130603/12687_1 /TAXON_ID=29189 /ORGANISM="Ammonia sp." /LENGTH=734 /DNA_ID=CAMNT_0042464587 /DNA_START=19 /DNA_END=2220 /DNA_ORIENTATION=-